MDHEELRLQLPALDIRPPKLALTLGELLREFLGDRLRRPAVGPPGRNLGLRDLGDADYVALLSALVADSLARDEIEAAFDWSLSLVSERKRPSIAAAKAHALLAIGDEEGARAETARWADTPLDENDLPIVVRLLAIRASAHR